MGSAPYSPPLPFFLSVYISPARLSLSLCFSPSPLCSCLEVSVGLVGTLGSLELLETRQGIRFCVLYLINTNFQPLEPFVVIKMSRLRISTIISFYMWGILGVIFEWLIVGWNYARRHIFWPTNSVVETSLVCFPKKEYQPLLGNIPKRLNTYLTSTRRQNVPFPKKFLEEIK